MFGDFGLVVLTLDAARWRAAFERWKQANQKDLRELPEEVRKEMEFVYAEHVGDVLQATIPALDIRVPSLV